MQSSKLPACAAAVLTLSFLLLPGQANIFGQTYYDYKNREERNLRGKVKSLKEFEWGVSDAKNFVKDSLNSPPDNITPGVASFIVDKIKSRMILRESLLFDEKGNVTESRRRVYRHGDGGPFYTRVSCQYDEVGRLTEADHYDTGDKLSYRLITKYESGGHKTEYIRAYRRHDVPLPAPKELFLASYNSRGNVLERREYDYESNKRNWPSVKGVYKYTYKYDGNGNLIEKKEIKSGKGSSPSLRWTYKWDERGKITEECRYGPGGKVIEKSVYKRDDKGNITHTDKYGPGDRVISKSTYTWDDKGNQTGVKIAFYDNGASSASSWSLESTFAYEYDRQGNWISSTTFSGGSVRGCSRREIEYYE